MSDTFKTVTVIGVGLLGGSLGLALKQRRMAETIRGVGHRQKSLDAALEIGAIDTGHLEPETAVQDADLIVLCTPAALVPPFLDQIRPHCKAGAVITDVASTKETICAHARDTWPTPLQFIGSHPMAGSEKSGPEHADPLLYQDAITFVEQGDHLHPQARDTIVKLWAALGSTVIDISPAQHDQHVARTSHLPHIVSAALAQLVDATPDLQPFIGSGFLDTTRIAEGRPEIWRDISLTNAQAIQRGLRDTIGLLQHFSDALADADQEKLMDYFQTGQDARRKASGL